MKSVSIIYAIFASVFIGGGLVSAHPSIEIVNPALNSEYNQNETIPLTLNISENSTVTANVSWDSTSQMVDMAFNGTEWIYNSSFSNTSYPGNYNIMFNATDMSGNSNSTSSNFTVLDVDAPALSDFMPALGAPYNQSDSILINVSVGESYYYSVDSVMLQVTYPNGTSVDYTMPEITNHIYGIAFNDTYAIGRYNFTITANDTSGNSDYIETYFIISDSAPPSGGGGGCSTRWECGSWSGCINNKQTRECIKLCGGGNRTEENECVSASPITHPLAVKLVPSEQSPVPPSSPLPVETKPVEKAVPLNISWIAIIATTALLGIIGWKIMKGRKGGKK